MKTTKSILKAILVFFFKLAAKIKTMFEATFEHVDIGIIPIGNETIFFDEKDFFEVNTSTSVSLLKKLYFRLKPVRFIRGEVEGDIAECLFFTENYSIKLTVSNFCRKVSIKLWYGTTGIFNETNCMFEKVYDIRKNTNMLSNSIRFDVSNIIFTNKVTYVPSVSN